MPPHGTIFTLFSHPAWKCWIVYYSCLMYHLYRKSLSLMSLHYFSPFLKHQNLETVHTDLTWKVIPAPAQVSPGTHNTIQSIVCMYVILYTHCNTIERINYSHQVSTYVAIVAFPQLFTWGREKDKLSDRKRVGIWRTLSAAYPLI